MGDLGIFYWEHEEGGSNNGYHFTYLGTEKKGDTVQTMGGTTVCNAHDDGEQYDCYRSFHQLFE